MLILITFNLEAQVTKTVDLVTPGTLSTLLSSTEKSTVTNLIITGNLNAQDFKCLRDEVSELTVLDLSNTSIKAYNGTNGTHPGVSAYPDNQLPQYSFFTYTGISKDKLVQINLPNSITSIGKNSFYSCKGLLSIIIPNSVTAIGDYAFQQCSAMKSITLGSGLQTIGDQGLYKTGIKVINSLSAVPPALGQFALEYNYISIVYVPSSSVSLYKSAAGWQSLPISTDELVSVNNATAGALAATLTTSGYQLSSISKLKISGNLNSVDFEQIKNNMPLIMELDLSEASVTGNALPNYALYGKNILTSVKLPPSIESIGESAFSLCTDLSEILPLPSSLKTIGYSAFSKCKSLIGDLVIPTTVTSIGDYSFDGCSGLNGKLILPPNIVTIANGAFSGCVNINGVITIPPSVTSIASSAFFNCKNISELILSEYCGSIGDEAFNLCTGLTKISVKRKTPPTIFSNTFGSVNKNTCILEVPSTSKSTYQAANYWKEFTNIIEKSDTVKITIQVGIGGKVKDGSNDLPNNTVLNVLSGASKTFTIVPDSGYEIDAVTYNGSDVKGNLVNNQYTASAINADAAFIVTFKRFYYLNVKIGAGGTVKENNVLLSDNQNIKTFTNDVKTFTILPDENFVVDSVIYNGQKVSLPLVNNQFTTPPIVADNSLKVVFKRIYRITVRVNSGGSIKENSTNLPNDTVLLADKNAIKTFTITPDTDYYLDSLYYGTTDVKSEVSNNLYTTPPINENRVLNVVFKKIFYNILIQTGSGGLVKDGETVLENNNVLAVDKDAEKIFSILPAEGYVLDTLEFRGVDVKNELLFNQYTTGPVTGNDTLKVTFISSAFTPAITFEIGENGFVKENNNTLANDTVLSVKINAVRTFTFIPSTGYELATLTFNGTDIIPNLEDKSYTTPPIQMDGTLKATFKKITYTIVVKIGYEGIVQENNLTLTDGSTLSAEYGTTKTFTFIPGTGYQIDYVTYGGSTVTLSESSNHFTTPAIIANDTLHVFFKKIIYTIFIKSDNNGVVKANDLSLPNGSTVSAEFGSSKSFSFNPAAGYEIESLKFGNTNVQLPLTNNLYTTPAILANDTLNVTFKKSTYIIILKSGIGGVVKLLNDTLPNGSLIQTEYDSKKSFTILPAAGYEIASLKFGNTNVQLPLTNNLYTTPLIFANDTLNVTFKKITYTITVITGTGGEVKENNIVLPTGSLLSAEAGSTKTFTITPKAGYNIASIMYGQSNVPLPLVNNQFTTGAINANATLNVAFQLKSEGIKEILIKVGSGGVVKNNNQVLMNNFILSVDSGSIKTFTFVPESGYRVSTLIYDGLFKTSSINKINNTYTTEPIIKNLTLSVFFELIPPIKTIILQKGKGGIVKENGFTLADSTAITADLNSTKTFVIKPDMYYKLASVSYNGEDVTSQLTSDSLFTTPAILVDGVLKVLFQKITYTLTVKSVAGGKVKENNTILADSALLTVEANSTKTFVIKPDTYYKLASVSYNGEDVTSRLTSDSLFTTPAILVDGVLKVLFQKITYTLTVKSVAGGKVKENNTILADSALLTVEANSTKTFVITPDRYYKLVSVSYNGEDVTSQLTSDSLFTTPAILKNDTLKVVFRKQVFGITIKTSEGGTVKDGVTLLKNDTTIFVEYGTDKVFVIKALEEWEIETITYNGILVSTEMVDSIFTASSISMDGLLEVVFKKSTSVSSIDISNVKVYTTRSEIIIEGVPENELIRIYTLNGVMIYNQKGESERMVIPVCEDAVYLVRTAGKTFKVIL